jgi:hypothetical protein
MARITFCTSRRDGSLATEHTPGSYYDLFCRTLRIWCLFLLTPILVSCGDNAATTAKSEETGTIEFRLEIKENNTETQVTILSPQEITTQNETPRAEDICINNGISTIQAFLYGSSGTLLKQGQWNCNAHSGQLNDITAGSGYVLRAEGYVGGTVKYKGELSGINVTANATTNAGTVTMTSLSPQPSNQLWNIENFNGGKVAATHSGLYMSVNTDGKNVLQLSNSHLWIFRANNQAYYEIVSKTYTDKCLDVPSASKLSQATVQIFACGQGDHQLWSLTDYGQGYYQIRNKNSGYCLDVASSSTASGAIIQQYPCK